MEIAEGSPSATSRLDGLPIDLLCKILSKIPARSLFCCRCVCKSWRDIIDGSLFSNMHNSRSLMSEDYQLLAFDRFEANYRLFLLKDDGGCTANPIVEMDEPIPMWLRWEFWCYGLFCFRKFHEEELLLLNPLRGEFMVSPPAKTSARNRFGMGYDCTTGTYKVVNVCASRIFDHESMAAEVYVLGTESWRAISAVPPYLPNTAAVVAHGDVHWLVVDSENRKIMVVSFDTPREDFRLTPFSEPLDIDYLLFFCPYDDSLGLFNYQGFLAISVVFSTPAFEIWLMKDYMNKKWTKGYKINIEQEFLRLEPSYWWGSTRIVGTWQDGLLIAVGTNDQLLHYNPKADSIRYIRQHSPPYNGYNRSIYSFTGNVISLKNYGNLIAKERVEGKYFNLRAAGLVSESSQEIKT